MSERFYSSNEEQQDLPQLKLHEPLPTAILAFFFTPLLGAIMISSNWKKLNKPESASRTMMIFYAYLVVLIGSYFAPPIAIFPIITLFLRSLSPPQPKTKFILLLGNCSFKFIKANSSAAGV